MKRSLAALIAVGFLSTNAFAAGSDVYAKFCAGCHHPERWGLSGPPLIPEYFGPKRQKEITAVVKDGLKATNMPGFERVLAPDELSEVVSFIMSPAKAPAWGTDEMLSTRTVSETGNQVKKPSYDMEDFFMIVEGGTGRVHFMDGSSFTLLSSVKAGAIHGGPKFDSSLKTAYIASRDGWVIRYDLVGLKETGRIRAGISARNIAISSDAKRIAAATLLPEALVIIDSAEMRPVKSFSGVGAISSVYSLRGEGKFVASLRDKPEILVIDQKSLELSRIQTDQPLTDFFIDPEERFIVGTSREGTHMSVIDLRRGMVARTVESEVKMPHLASAAFWTSGNASFAAFPHIGEPLVSVLELYTWEPKGVIKTKGPGFFARTHDNIPELWVDTGTDTIQLIDKKALKVTREVVPSPGKKAMHIEFTKNGAYALVSVWEDDGAVVIYDSSTLKPVKTFPFKKPVGKYNATNKKF